jgi:hypothetical protein
MVDVDALCYATWRDRTASEAPSAAAAAAVDSSYEGLV